MKKVLRFSLIIKNLLQKNILLLFLIILLIGSLIDYSSSIWSQKIFISSQNGLQNLLLFLASEAAFYYAYETYKMRDEMARQNKLQIRPILLIYFRVSEERFRIRNVGKGIANNIEFNETELKSSKESILLKFKLCGENYLLPNEERDIDTEIHLNGSEITSKGFKRFFLNPSNLMFDAGLQVRAYDISWTPYLFTIHFGKSGTRLVGLKTGYLNCDFD